MKLVFSLLWCRFVGSEIGRFFTLILLFNFFVWNKRFHGNPFDRSMKRHESWTSEKQISNSDFWSLSSLLYIEVVTFETVISTKTMHAFFKLRSIIYKLFTRTSYTLYSSFILSLSIYIIYNMYIYLVLLKLMER